TSSRPDSPYSINALTGSSIALATTRLFTGLYRQLSGNSSYTLSSTYQKIGEDHPLTSVYALLLSGLCCSGPKNSRTLSYAPSAKAAIWVYPTACVQRGYSFHVFPPTPLLPRQ